MIGWACAQPFPTLAMPLGIKRGHKSGHKFQYMGEVLASSAKQMKKIDYIIQPFQCQYVQNDHQGTRDHQW